MHYIAPVYRHPREASSIMLETTIGCTHNSCRFCTFYRDTSFRMAPLSQIEEDLKEVKGHNPGARFSITTITILPESDMYQDILAGRFIPPSELERIQEMLTLGRHLENAVYVYGRSAASHIQFTGHIPKDREAIIKGLEKVINRFSANDEASLK